MIFTKSRQTQHNETMTIQDKTVGEVSLLFNRLCKVCRTMKLTLCQSLEVTRKGSLDMSRNVMIQLFYVTITLNISQPNSSETQLNQIGHFNMTAISDCVFKYSKQNI